MSIEVNRPSIYLNSVLEESAQAPQVIGSIWANLKSALADSDEREITSLMGRLGVTQTDRAAHKALLPILKRALLHENVLIEPSEDATETGIYFLSLDGKKFAVFKIGEKRARTELLVRHIAHKFGLEKHAVAGLFCSIANPTFPKGETCVELWNGGLKVFLPEESTQEEEKVQDLLFPDLNFEDFFEVEGEDVIARAPCDDPTTITGILEPFLPDEKQITSDDFIGMVILASLIGLRDGKADGNRGNVMVDTADSFVSRIEPPEGENPDLYQASLHIPFLGNSLNDEAISEELLDSVIQILDKKELGAVALMQLLQSQTVIFADLKSELEETSLSQSLELEDSDTDSIKGPMTYDHGNNRVKIAQQSCKLHQLVPDPIKVTSGSTPMMTESQVDAFINRAFRLKIFLEECRDRGHFPNAQEIVCKIDSHYSNHLSALRRKQNRHSPFDLTGWVTPKETHVSVQGSSPSSSVSNLHSPPPPLAHLPPARGFSAPNAHRAFSCDEKTEE